MNQKGFTLIELMIAVVIVAVIAAFALPSFRDNAMKTRRAIAKSVLMDVQSKEEEFFINNKVYTEALDDLDTKYASPMYIDDQGIAVAQADAFYEITVNLVDNSLNYLIEAEPINDQARDTTCGTLSLSNTGAKTPLTCW